MLVNIFIPLMFTLIPIILFVRFPISIAHPTSRGLHHNPTASSGGIAILIGYVAITISAMILHGHNLTTNSMILPMVLASLLGFFDDKASLSKITRFVIQTILAIWIIYINPVLPSYIKIFWLLLVIYFINIYNFMDGINGLATSQAIFTLISYLADQLVIRNEDDLRNLNIEYNNTKTELRTNQSISYSILSIQMRATTIVDDYILKRNIWIKSLLLY